MTLEIRLLGLVEVRRDGQLLRLGGPRQRRRPVLLALHPGRIRTTDSICASLWPDGDLPSTPPGSPHLRLALRGVARRRRRGRPRRRLRACVAPCGDRAGGASRLSSEAAATGCARERAVELLTEALGSVAGRASTASSRGVGAADAVRLEELRAGRSTTGGGAARARPRHGDAVADLRPARRRPPLRERPSPADVGAAPRPPGRGAARSPALPAPAGHRPRPRAGR